MIDKKKGKALIARDCGWGLFFDSDKVERGGQESLIDFFVLREHQTHTVG